MGMPRLWAGASGYAFKEWQGSFYPEKIQPEAMLAWYAERLPSVEINNTFYRMPKASVLAALGRGHAARRSASRSRRRSASRTTRAWPPTPRRNRWPTCTGTWPRSAPSAGRCCSSCRRS